MRRPLSAAQPPHQCGLHNAIHPHEARSFNQNTARCGQQLLQGLPCLHPVLRGIARMHRGGVLARAVTCQGAQRQHMLNALTGRVLPHLLVEGGTLLAYFAHIAQH